MDKFLELMEDVIEKDSGTVKPGDKFKEFEEWDSLALLSLIAMINEEYDITISRIELDKISTIKELYTYIQEQSNE